MAKLAINGGKAVRTNLFPAYNTIGQEEKEAVMRVLDTGNLSQFLGAHHNDFLGGPSVRAFEENWASSFGEMYYPAYEGDFDCSYIWSSSRNGCHHGNSKEAQPLCG